METVSSLERRIGVAETIHSIVRNMKALASVGIHRFEEAAFSLERYALTVDLGLQIALRQRRQIPDVTRGGEGETGLVVVGSSLGLAGRFNERVAVFVQRYVESSSRGQPRLLVLGGYLTRRFETMGLRVEKELGLPTSVAGIATSVQTLLGEIERWRDAGVSETILCFNHRHAETPFVPRAQALLPIDPAWLKELRAKPWPTRQLPTHTMAWRPLFSALVREYLFVQLFRSLAESLAAEQANRLESMSAAQRNIERRLGQLRHAYHERRQAAMTEELLDIVNGWEVTRDVKSAP